MVTYKEIKGDLIDLAKKGTFDVIAHGCNCFTVMGAGIAAQIRDHFPIAVKIDAQYQSSMTPYNMLGTISATQVVNSDNFTIVNCYTQYYPGRDLDYTALMMCLKKLNYLYKGKTIGLPQIGCGIGGGDWSIVKDLIQTYLKDVNVTVVIYKRNEKKSKDKQG